MSVEMQDFDFRTGQMHAQGAPNPVDVSAEKATKSLWTSRKEKSVPKHQDAFFFSETLDNNRGRRASTSLDMRSMAGSNGTT
jgi:hypothetical protein